MKPLMELNSFKKCQAGNVSMMFAAAILPILGTIGFAVDFSRASEVKAQLSAAVDATALAVAHASATLTDAQLQAKATDAFNRNFKPGTTASSSVRANRDTGTISVNGSAAFKTSFLRVLNISTLDVTAHSKAVWGSQYKVEVVLALDNTGSMAGTKLTELKKAATALVNTLKAAQIPGVTDSVKIGLVPFATMVRLDPTVPEYRDAEWLRREKVSYQERECTRKRNGDGEWYDDCQDVTKTRDFIKANWQGCIQDRDQTDNYDVTDKPYDVQKSNTLYPAVESCGSEERNLLTVQPLTTNFEKLIRDIDKMKAAGNTNVTIGIAWGMSLLSKQKPFQEGAADAITVKPNTPPANNPQVGSEIPVKKYLIVLTDGENTKNRAGNNSGGAVDARTKLACEEAHKMGTIFTIRMIEGDKNLLKACASKAENYKEVSEAGQLTGVFQSIGNEIASLRLAE